MVLSHSHCSPVAPPCRCCGPEQANQTHLMKRRLLPNSLPHSKVRLITQRLGGNDDSLPRFVLCLKVQVALLVTSHIIDTKHADCPRTTNTLIHSRHKPVSRLPLLPITHLTSIMVSTTFNASSTLTMSLLSRGGGSSSETPPTEPWGYGKPKPRPQPTEPWGYNTR
jgi:hypothetical protein